MDEKRRIWGQPIPINPGKRCEPVTLVGTMPRFDGPGVVYGLPGGPVLIPPKITHPEHPWHHIYLIASLDKAE